MAAKVHEQAIAKIRGAKFGPAVVADAMRDIARHAESLNGAKGEITISYLDDDEKVEHGTFVPEITYRMRRFPFDQ